MPKYDEYTKEQLLEEINKLTKQKKFGLVWEDKPENVVEQCKTNFPVLQELPERAILNAKYAKEAQSTQTTIFDANLCEPCENFDCERLLSGVEATHLIIEGDNYHALSVLNVTHKGKIDVIYIDPPYNTGAKDWKYNNDYVDDNDNYRHSKWLSMMSNRLRIAKNLLSEAGVLICTIDKYEQANLGVLLNELFSDKEIVCVTIIHNPGGIQGNNFSHTNEYAFFIYPKNGIFITTNPREDVEPTAFRDWGKETALRASAKTCFYPILVKNDKIVGFGDVCIDSFHPQSCNIIRQDGVIEVYPIDKNGTEMKWRFGRETVLSIEKELICKKVKGQYSIYRNKTDYRWKTVWTDTKYNANVYGTKLLGEIIDVKFPYPKSLYAVMDCINAVVHNKNSAIILDFFAGSGTTGHAVLELNKEDGGNRQFILCTNNENGICEEVTYPRIKTVVTGNREDGSKYSDGIPANVRYFKTDFVSNRGLDDVSDEDRVNLTLKAGAMIAIKENVFQQTELNEWWQIFEDGEKMVAIYFKESKAKINELIEKIGEKKCVLYIFGWGKNEYAEEYGAENIEIKDIPEPILKIYKQINSIKN